MRKITNVSENLKNRIENSCAILAYLDYKFADVNTAYVFADGRLLEIIFEPLE